MTLMFDHLYWTIADYRAPEGYKLQSTRYAEGWAKVITTWEPPEYTGPQLPMDFNMYEEEPWDVGVYETALLGYVSLYHPEFGLFETPVVSAEGWGEEYRPISIHEIHLLQESRESEQRAYRVANPKEAARSVVRDIRYAIETVLREEAEEDYHPDDLDFDFSIDYDTAPMKEVRKVLRRYVPKYRPDSDHLIFEAYVADETETSQA